MSRWPPVEAQLAAFGTDLDSLARRCDATPAVRT